MFAKVTARNCLFFVLVLVFLYSVFTLNDHPGMVDTVYYTDAAMRLATGHSLYERAEGQAYGYMYGPAFAYAVMWAMQILSAEEIHQITWVMQHLFWATLGALFVLQTKGSNMRMLVAMTYLFSLPFRYGLEYGNLQVVIDTVLVLAPALVEQNTSAHDSKYVGLKRLAAAAPLGVVAAIKISPIFLIFVFVGGGIVHYGRTREIDEWAKTGALAILVFALCILFTPFSHTVEFFAELRRISVLTSQDGLPPTSVQYALTRLLNIDEPISQSIIRCTALLVLVLSCFHRRSMVRTLAAYWTIMVVNPFAWPYTVGLMLYAIVVVTQRYPNLQVRDFRPFLGSMVVVIVAFTLVGYDMFYQISSALVDEAVVSSLLKLVGTVPIVVLTLIAMMVPRVLQVTAQDASPDVGG